MRRVPGGIGMPCWPGPQSTYQPGRVWCTVPRFLMLVVYGSTRASTKSWFSTCGTCSTCGSCLRSTHEMDESELAPGATTAVLVGSLSLRTLWNSLTGPFARLDTSMLVMVRNVTFVCKSGSPYV
jgi:hypothetical protein